MTKTAERIMCVHSGGPTLRGSEWALLDILLQLLKIGKHIVLLCDQTTLRDKANELGITARLIPYGEIMIEGSDSAFHPFLLIRANLQILKQLKIFHADIVYCNGGRALQMAYLAASIARLPTVVHLHAPYSKRYLYLYGITRADLTIHCSDAIRIGHDKKASIRSSATLRNAVQVDVAPSIDKILIRPRNIEPVLGFFGSLIPRKGLDILIEAVRKVLNTGRKCQLKVGGHEHSDEYRIQVAALGLTGHVHFIGEVPRGKVADFFECVDLHVLPSRGDAMPLSIIEAAICGVPSIAHNIGGISESLMNGMLGILYDDNTSEHLCQIICDVIDRQTWLSPEKRKFVAETARAEFNLPNNAKALALMFDSVME